MHPVRIGAYFDMLSKSQKGYSKILDPVCKKWDLTRSEMDVLLFLYNNPQYDRAADIVTRRGMTKSLVSMSVSTLEARGLLQRQCSATDRRTMCLHLTEAGEKIAAEGREAQRQFFARLYTGISEEELALWDSITQRVYKNIEELSKAL